MRKLDIGCGPIYRKGYDRMDFDKEVNPHILHDLNKFPWPIDNNYYDSVIAYHVIEHLPEINPFLREVLRISKDNAYFRFDFPSYHVTFIFPTHRRGYGCQALESFKEFVIVKPRMEWSGGRKRNPKTLKGKFKWKLYCGLNNVLTHLANHNPYVCERTWAYIVGGFSNVILEGRIDKSKSKDAWFRDDEVFNK